MSSVSRSGGYKAITSPNAPKPNPLYSPAIVHNGIVYCSGSIGTDPQTMRIVQGGIGERTTQCLKNLVAVLEAAGSKKENILMVYIYLTDMNDAPAMNVAYEQFFPNTPRPARATVAVAGMARGSDVEIQCTAFISGREATSNL